MTLCNEWAHDDNRHGTDKRKARREPELVLTSPKHRSSDGNNLQASKLNR
jgi:hypothetical protein